MSSYNYIATTQNPTAVSHSCVGNFTGPEDHNLIIAFRKKRGKGDRIYGKISTLELFRPRGETQDLLLIATQRHKFSVLRWDPDAEEIVTRAICDTSGTHMAQTQAQTRQMTSLQTPEHMARQS